MISIIAALSENYAIGKDGKIPWHISSDLKNFKNITIGKPIVMGRKTYESLGKPLPGRPHIVISRSKLNLPDNCFSVNNIKDAILKAKEFHEEVMVIGGGTIYEQSLPLADRMYLSFVPGNFVGDAFFPKVNLDEWVCVEEKDFQDFKFKIFDKK